MSSADQYRTATRVADETFLSGTLPMFWLVRAGREHHITAQRVVDDPGSLTMTERAPSLDALSRDPPAGD